MNNKQHRKVRYVKCPKCARILPEPEQVPLYTCGGCDTILQAKYYRRQREASVPTLPTEDVQSNGNVHASEVVQSSGEQSPLYNEDGNEKAVDVGDRICVHPTSLTEESTALDIKDDNVIVGDKEAEKLPIETETKEDGSGQDQYGGDIVVESEDEQIRNVNYVYEISTRREFEVLRDGKSQQCAMVNEATYDESDKGEQREVIALDKQEEVGNKKSAKEFEPVMQLGTDNVAEGYKDSGNEIKCLAEDKLVRVAKLGKEEKSRKEPKSFIERIRGKLAGVTLTEVVDGNENSLLQGGEASLGAYASLSPSDVPQDTDCGPSLLETVNKTSRLKTEDLDDCLVDQNILVDKAGTSDPLDTRNDNLLEGVPRSPTKRSSTYGESLSSSDGNDHQVLGQLDQINGEISTGKEIEAKEDKKDKGEECEDGALDKQKEVGHGNSAKVASMTTQYQPNELPEQFGPANAEEGSRVSGDDINCLAEDVPAGVAKLGKEEESGKEQKSFIDRICEKVASVKSSDEAPISTEVQNENEGSLPGVEASLEAARERIASNVPGQSDSEINLTDNVEEIWKQNTENLDDSDFSESEQNRPIRNVEISEPSYRHEKVGNLLGGLRRSPTKRSPAYDGSVSSCDGNDDQVRRQSERLNEKTFSGAEENSDWIRVPLVRNNYGNLRSQARVKSSSNQLSEEKLARQFRDGVLPPRIPFNRISSEVAFETGSSSSYVHDEPPRHWTHREPHSQLGYMEGRRFSEASWKENEFLPMYYNEELSRDYRRYSSASKRRSESLFLSGNLPRSQYSGDIVNRKHQIQDPYIHRPPDARHWSTQLPSGPPGYYHHPGPMTYMDLPGEVKWEPYDPYPINPYGWAHDTIYHSDDQRHKERITKKLHVREKRQTVKRCLRPMAGGAPFITCHFCFTVLQLPEEFLLPKGKRIHRVKCGTCSNILEFSLENESCLAPRLPYASETDPGRDVKSDSPSRASHSRESILVPSEARNSSEALGRQKSSSRTEERQAKVTWELPARSKSPLHRLMGYPSPRDLFTDDKE